MLASMWSLRTEPGFPARAANALKSQFITYKFIPKQVMTEAEDNQNTTRIASTLFPIKSLTPSKTSCTRPLELVYLSALLSFGPVFRQPIKICLQHSTILLAQSSEVIHILPKYNRVGFFTITTHFLVPTSVFVTFMLL